MIFCKKHNLHLFKISLFEGHSIQCLKLTVKAMLAGLRKLQCCSVVLYGQFWPPGPSMVNVIEFYFDDMLFLEMVQFEIHCMSKQQVSCTYICGLQSASLFNFILRRVLVRNLFTRTHHYNTL